MSERFSRAIGTRDATKGGNLVLNSQQCQEELRQLLVNSVLVNLDFKFPSSRAYLQGSPKTGQ